MLVVISDLHFEEEQRDVIPGTEIGLRRNLPAYVYRKFIAELAIEAKRNKAKRLDLVLAGDVFDLHRTIMWFTDGAPGDITSSPAPVRPYISCSDTGEALECKIKDILDSIATEHSVKETLGVFALLAQQQRFIPDASPDGKLEDFPACVTLYYLPGNHDRLVDATPQIRSTVRSLLGLQGKQAFDHAIISEDPRVLVRHGHEYDRFNFSVDHRDTDSIPSRLPRTVYDAPTFGDLITIDVASALPYRFRVIHGDDAIARDPVLSKLYLGLLEFDDVRPQAELVPFLLTGTGLDEKDVWERLEPVTTCLLDDLCEDEFLRVWLNKLEKQWQPDWFDVIQAALSAKIWRAGLPLQLVKGLAGRMHGEGGPTPVEFAAKEKAIRDGSVRFVVTGHTHKPCVEHIGKHGSEEQFYVDTGTWRNRVMASPAGNSFGKVKSLSYVVFYASDEDPARRGGGGIKTESFDYWSGYTQKWRHQ
jgi:UDP-2,3-diacylglucosamine pyrophosphatase LpxH